MPVIQGRRTERCRIGTLASIIALGSLVLLATRAQATPQFMGLGFLPGMIQSRPDDVSADGSVVVGVTEDNGAIGARAFRWTRDGGMVDLEADFGLASGVSADGSIVVGRGVPPGEGAARAFRWTSADGLVWLDMGEAFAISGDGSTIVGVDLDGEGARWTSGGGTEGLGEPPSAIPLDVSFDGSVAVGLIDGLPEEVFRWTSEAGVVGLDFAGSARSISADGSTIVGVSHPTDDINEAFLWTIETGRIDLGFLPGPSARLSSNAADVSGDGAIVVGSSETGNFDPEAIIWDESNGMRSLEVVLEGLGVDLGGWDLDFATAISADGKTIVGYGRNPSGGIEAWIAVIPEPGTALLVGLGLSALAMRERPVGRSRHVPGSA